MTIAQRERVESSRVGRWVGITIATCILLTSVRPAYADEAGTTVDPLAEARFLRTAAFVGYGVGAASLAVGFVSLASANSAFSDRRDIARANGDVDSRVWRCQATNQCAEMAGLRLDQDRYGLIAAAAFSLSAVSAVLATSMLFGANIEQKKGNARLRLLPSVDRQAASLGVGGTF